MCPCVCVLGKEKHQTKKNEISSHEGTTICKNIIICSAGTKECRDFSKDCRFQGKPDKKEIVSVCTWFVSAFTTSLITFCNSTVLLSA